MIRVERSWDPKEGAIAPKSHAGTRAVPIAAVLRAASIQITLDRYVHLMPGNEEAAAQMLDAYLARASASTRVAQVT